MKARLLKLDPGNFDPDQLDLAAKVLRDGGLVAFPTETVYGIGVNLDLPDSVRRLLSVRRSPMEKNLTVHLASREEVGRYVAGTIPLAAQRLMRRFWPGPLTLVFPEGEKSIGLRYPDHPIARELIRRAGVKVGAPSANHSGQPPAVAADDVVRLLGDELDVVVDGGPCRHGTSSTVVRVEGRSVQVLREGAISSQAVREANAAVILFVCTGNTCRSPIAERLCQSLLARKLGVAVADLPARGYRVISAGTAAGNGASASTEAEIAVQEFGGDLSGHRSQPVSISMAEDADRIYAMTRSHQETLLEWMPDLRNRVALLDPTGEDIHDPIGGTLETYRRTTARIHLCLQKRLSEL